MRIVVGTILGGVIGYERDIHGRPAGLRTHAPHGQRSSLWLKEDEWKSLIPEAPQKGQTHPVAPKLAKRIWLYGLVPQSLWVVEETCDVIGLHVGGDRSRAIANSVEAVIEVLQLEGIDLGL